MKALLIFQAVFLALMCAVSGCKSPTAAVSMSAPYVTITPSNFRGAEFVADTFQARIFNHDFAQTYFTWTISDTNIILKEGLNSFSAIHTFTTPGTYKITVKANDVYSNSVIASDSTSVLIDTVKSTVEIIPQFYNGIASMIPDGEVPFTLSVKTDLPDSDLFQFWDFGDGTKESYLSGAIDHRFPQPGNYLLRVDIYQRNGIFVGSDTAAINIKWPDISLDSLKNMSRVEAFLNIDSTYSVFQSARTSLPLSLGLLYTGGNITTSWNGNVFSIEYSSNLPRDYSISTTISSDFKEVTSITISVNNSDPVFNYTFSAQNLKLISINPSMIVYAVSGDLLTNNLLSESFANPGNNFNGSYVGDAVHSWSNFFNNKITAIPPFYILVFSKQ